MPVALIMSVLLDLMESRGIERLEKDLAALPAPVTEPVPHWEEAERWDGMS